MPKKLIGKFRKTEPGVSIGRLNSMVTSINSMERVFGSPSYEGAFSAEKNPQYSSLVMVRLTENIGPDESSEFRNRSGIVQYWDATNYKWKDTYPERTIDVIAMPYGHFPVPENSIVLCWYCRQASSYVIVNNPQIVHVRTVNPASGTYPTGGGSKTYPIAFTITGYDAELDVFSMDSDIMDDDVNRLNPSPPHGGKATGDDRYGFVYNLGEGYIPVNTDIHAWFACGQLYTYYTGGGVIGRTKTGGISAMTGVTWPYQPGSGSVDVATWNGFMELVDSGSDLVVFNTTHATVPADRIVQIKYVQGVPVVDVDDCPNGS